LTIFNLEDTLSAADHTVIYCTAIGEPAAMAIKEEKRPTLWSGFPLWSNKDCHLFPWNEEGT